jgi:protein SCO1
MYARRFLLAGLGATSLGALSATVAAPAPPPAPAAARRGQRIPNVELTTHTGAKVKFYDDLIRGKLVAINFMYALCNASCPPVTHNLVRVQELLGKRVGKDVFMYSISLRPEQDTPQELAHYAKVYGVKPGWLFLTGSPQNVEAVRYALGFYDPDAAVDKEAARHIGMVRIGNDRFDRWAMAPALAAPEQILSSIRHLDRSTSAMTARTR